MAQKSTIRAVGKDGDGDDKFDVSVVEPSYENAAEFMGRYWGTL